MSETKLMNIDPKEYETLLNDRKFAHKIRTQRKMATAKRNAELMIYKIKAKKKGISVSSDEIDKYLIVNKK